MPCITEVTQQHVHVCVCVCVCVCVGVRQQAFERRNDPSAGSPTDALLRLLFPLDHTVRLSFHRSPRSKAA